MTANRNTTRHTPETSIRSEATFSPTRAVLVIVMTAGLAASSIIMVGPQILLIVPLALATGVVFALRQSFWSLVCFGYPFTFGLISAAIGFACVIFMKRHMLETEPDHVLTFAILVAFTHGFIYQMMMSIMCKVHPATAQFIKNKRAE